METRFTEIRADGKRLLGTVINYGDIAVVGGQPERFAPGSLLCSDVVLNRQHQRDRPLARTGAGLILRDGPESLKMEAVLPETSEARDTLTLVSSGVLRGLSAEFEVISEHYEDGTRVIDLANLSGLGVVDRSAYPASTVEARAKQGPMIRAFVPQDTSLGCRCSGPECRYATFTPEAIDTMFQSLSEREVLAVLSSYGSPLASTSRGTVRGKRLENGLSVEIDVPEGMVDDLLDKIEAAPVYVRPHLDRGLSEGIIQGVTMAYSAAILRALVIGSTDASEGWGEPEYHNLPRRRHKAERLLWL